MHLLVLFTFFSITHSFISLIFSDSFRFCFFFLYCCCCCLLMFLLLLPLPLVQAATAADEAIVLISNLFVLSCSYYLFVFVCMAFLLKYTWEMQTFFICFSIDKTNATSFIHSLCTGPHFQVEKMIIAFYAIAIAIILFIFVMCLFRRTQNMQCHTNICVWHRNVNGERVCVFFFLFLQNLLKWFSV